MKEEDKIKGHENTPKWLKTIQLNSWEAELLISALVLYALFQVPEYLDQYALREFTRDSRLPAFLKVLIKAVRLLSVGYILHILVRGIWVASIGLSYVYPGGINTDRLNFKGKFKKELTFSKSLINAVLRLEKLSSVIYGISFVFFGTVLGFGVFLFSFIYAFEFIQPMMETNAYLGQTVGLLILLYAFLSLLVFIDFLTNGLFRRKNWAAEWFYYVAIFFRIITLSFLYRRSLLVLISNTKGWKSHLVPIIILAVIIGFNELTRSSSATRFETYLSESTQPTFKSMSYENLRKKDDLLVATLQSDIIDQKVLRVFLDDLKIFGRIYMLENKGKNEWDGLTSNESSLLLNKWLSIKVDATEIVDIDWFINQHPIESEFGFNTIIDIQGLERGTHNLSISFDTTQMKPFTAESFQNDVYRQLYISNMRFFYNK